VTVPPCPRLAGIYHGRTKLVILEEGVHWSKILDGRPVVIMSSETKLAPTYTVKVSLPAECYSLHDTDGVTHAAVDVVVSVRPPPLFCIPRYRRSRRPDP
jgi:hypothetical protein